MIHEQETLATTYLTSPSALLTRRPLCTLALWGAKLLSSYDPQARRATLTVLLSERKARWAIDELEQRQLLTADMSVTTSGIVALSDLADRGFPIPPLSVIQSLTEDGAGRPSTAMRPHEALRDYFVRKHNELMASVEAGGLVIRGEADIRTIASLLSEHAKTEILALDTIPIEDWFRVDLMRYLQLQLDKAQGGIRVQRIRIFDPSELEDPDRRQLLRHFLAQHEEAGAELLLSPMTARETEELARDQLGYQLIIDKDDDPISLRGIVGDSGRIELAELDLRFTDNVRIALQRYKDLLDSLRQQHLHEEVVQLLEAGKPPLGRRPGKSSKAVAGEDA